MPCSKHLWLRHACYQKSLLTVFFLYLVTGFFDYYIIPLTKKLKECGVFGVSSGEFLDFAQKNREEWERQGEEVVAGMIEDCERKYGKKGVMMTRGTKVPRLRVEPSSDQSHTVDSSASSFSGSDNHRKPCRSKETNDKVRRPLKQSRTMDSCSTRSELGGPAVAPQIVFDNEVEV